MTNIKFVSPGGNFSYYWQIIIICVSIGYVVVIVRFSNIMQVIREGLSFIYICSSIKCIGSYLQCATIALFFNYIDNIFTRTFYKIVPLHGFWFSTAK